MLLIMGITLYTSRIVLSILGVNDFGIYNVVGGIIVMLGFLNSSMSSATQRFLSYELGKKNTEDLKKVFSISLSIHIIIAIIILIIAETIGLWIVNSKLTIPDDRLYAANWVYQFSILSFILNVLSVPYNALIISHEKMSIYAYISFIEIIFKLLILYPLSIINFDKLIFYSFLTCITSFVVRLIYQFYCKSKYPESKYRFVWDIDIAKKMTFFSGWNLFGSITYIMRKQGTNILLNIFFGPVVNASKALAYQIESGIESLASNFQAALNPQIIKSVASENQKRTLDLFQFGCKISFFLMLCLIITIYYDIEYILSLWLGNIPEYCVIFTQIVLIEGLINTLSRNFNNLVQAIGSIKAYNIINGLFFISILPISYVLLKLGFSAVSTLVIIVISSFIGLFLRIYLINKLIEISIMTFYKVVILRLLLCTVFTFTGSYLINNLFFIGNPHLSFLIKSLTSFSIAIPIIFFIGLNNNEKSLIKNVIKKKLKNETSSI